MRYFSHLSNYNKANNQLHRETLKMLRERSNVLTDDVDAFLVDLRRRRCKRAALRKSNVC